MASSTGSVKWLLLQSLNDDFPFRQNLDAGRFERAAGGRSVREKEMRGAFAAHDPGAAAFDADTGTAQDFAHFGERAGPVIQSDREILHHNPPQAN